MAKLSLKPSLDMRNSIYLFLEGQICCLEYEIRIDGKHFRKTNSNLEVWGVSIFISQDYLQLKFSAEASEKTVKGP